MHIRIIWSLVLPRKKVAHRLFRALCGRPRRKRWWVDCSLFYFMFSLMNLLSFTPNRIHLPNLGLCHLTKSMIQPKHSFVYKWSLIFVNQSHRDGIWLNQCVAGTWPSFWSTAETYPSGVQSKHNPSLFLTVKWSLIAKSFLMVLKFHCGNILAFKY